ncbi:hypothetical protein BXY39_1126 [Eilatimonas milleporae]|uniref:Uncharacterized protein n=1 Tax=Eilatimonas milleporae TaxID=911205 RepID=A0A3M0CXB2_9PROT|nr:hypothetical protein BXY39_1126 [Eilatimonas milleporae]
MTKNYIYISFFKAQECKDIHRATQRFFDELE